MPPANNNSNPALQQYSSAFLGAPLSKFVAAMTVIAYITINTKRATAVFEFDADQIRHRGETYRYVTSKMAFTSTSQLVVGTILLSFLLRKFERETGTRKMVLFCLFILLSTMAVESFIVQSSILSFNLHYGGPYPLIGALGYFYHKYTPRLNPRYFSVLGIHFSEKIFQYLWLLQVALSGGWNSVCVVAIGWFLALFYELLPLLKTMDFPNVVADLMGDLSSRVLEAPPRILVPQAARGGRMYQQRAAAATAVAAAQQAATAGGGVRPTAAAQRAPVAADPSAVEQLTLMGFSRAQVVEALQSTNNDVQRAAERLLTQQGAQ